MSDTGSDRDESPRFSDGETADPSEWNDAGERKDANDRSEANR